MKSIKLTSITLIVLLLCTTTILSQDVLIDSLKIELQHSPKNDTNRVEILYELAYETYRSDTKLANSYIEEASVISDQLDYKKGKASVFYIKGIFEVRKAKYQVGRTYFKKSLEIAKTITDNKDQEASVYNAIGISYLQQSRYKESLPYLEKMVMVSEEINDEENLVAGNLNIATVYLNLGNVNEAIFKYKEVINLAQKIDHKYGVAYALNNLAIIHKSRGNYPLALDYYNQGLSQKEKLKDSVGMANSFNGIGHIYRSQEKYDKALAFYNKSLNIFKKIENKNHIANTKNNIGLVYEDKKEYHKALQFIEESLKLSTEIGNNQNIANCYSNFGNIYQTLQQSSKARENYKKAKDLYDEIGDQQGFCIASLGIAETFISENQYNRALPIVLESKGIAQKLELLEAQKEAEHYLFTIYNKNKNYKKALVSHQQFKLLNDSLFNKENIERITQLEYEYKYKRVLDSAKIKELKLTKTVTDTSKSLKKSQQNYLWAIIGILSISVLFGSIIFYQKYRNIKAKNQNIITEQRLLRSQMTPHFIFNSLSVLQGMILNKEDKKSVSYLSKFSKLLRIILENSRDKTVLLSEELTAIENYLALHNLENETYQFTIEIGENIDTSLFRIPPMLIQPFIENAIEHAFPNKKENKQIDVVLSYAHKNLVCNIKDNGIGINAFAKAKENQKKSLATKITSERLQLLSTNFKMRGSIVIEDRQQGKEQGTIVTIVIPYKTIIV